MENNFFTDFDGFFGNKKKSEKRSCDDINPKKSKETYVYVMQCDQYIKIGVSKNPEARLKELQTGNPSKITLLLKVIEKDPYFSEKYYHNKFKNHLVNGEWFKITPEIKIVVKQLKQREYDESKNV